MKAKSVPKIHKRMKLFCVILIFIAITCPTYGQSSLSIEDLTLLQKRATVYVQQFEYLIPKIAISKSVDEKSACIKEISDYFLDDATIEVSNLNGKVKKPLLIDYLKNIVSKYSDKFELVVIDFYATRIEKLNEKTDRDGNKYYEGYFSFHQRFCGQKKSIKSFDLENRTFTYCDETVKRGKIKVFRAITIEGERWFVKLGDITVEKTSAIN